jgi:pyrimidine-specific ribonucleoside hydrolase
VEAAQPDGFGHDMIAEFFRSGQNRVLLTGAPLGNPRQALEKHGDFDVPRWVGQGGFAGDSVVPEEFRLSKFKGLETCPTFNFNGDRKGAALMLNSPRVLARELVSKNVCHGMSYNKAMHNEVAHASENPAFNTFVKLMNNYLAGRPEGKLFHDPLAAATIIRQDICAYEEVELYCANGGWGSRKKEGTGTRISVSADRQKFIEVLRQVSK